MNCLISSRQRVCFFFSWCWFRSQRRRRLAQRLMIANLSLTWRQNWITCLQSSFMPATHSSTTRRFHQIKFQFLRLMSCRTPQRMT